MDEEPFVLALWGGQPAHIIDTVLGRVRTMCAKAPRLMDHDEWRRHHDLEGHGSERLLKLL